MPFRVGRNPSVDAQIKALGAIARKLGILALYKDALLRIHSELENRPLEFGEPEYSINSTSGLICHGVHQPLLVRYAVFEPEQIVHIMEIKPFPGSVFFTR